MAIGERIRFIRNLRGMTQKWLGQAVGFPPKTADVRHGAVRVRFQNAERGFGKSYRQCVRGFSLGAADPQH